MNYRVVWKAVFLFLRDRHWIRPDTIVCRTCELGTLLSSPVNFSLRESRGSLHFPVSRKGGKGII